MVGVEVVADTRPNGGPVDQHRPAAPHPPLRLHGRADDGQSRDHHPDPQCETGHTSAPD